MPVALVPWLIALAAGAAAWCSFWPDPLGLSVAMSVVLPWLAVPVIAASKGEVVLDGPRGLAKPGVSWVLLLSTIALVLRTEFDVNTLDHARPIAYGVVLGVAMALAHVAADRGVWRRASWIFIPFMMAHGWGTVALGNTLLDRSTPAEFRTEIVSKYSTSGKTVSHYLVLGPWGPRADTTDIRVDTDQYNAARTGVPVCVHLYDGAIGIAWFAVAPCRPK